MTVTRTLAVLATVLGCAALAAAPAAPAGRHAEIVGGSPAPAGAWPSTAYLEGSYHDRKGREHVYACTGSVVAPQWIATAAHCTFGSGDRAPERMVATLGVTDRTDPAGERIAVDRFVPYPSYDSAEARGDVGLLHLAQPTTRPPLPFATTDAVDAGRYSSPRGVPNAAGWGAIDEDGTQLLPQLQEAYLQVRAPAACRSLISGFDADTQTCAGTAGAAGACVGDSGGPLVELDRETGKPALWGVTSYAPERPEGLATCSVDMPAVYTWIPAYAQFIQSTLAKPPTASGSEPTTGSAPVPAVARPGDRAARAACRKARAAVTAARKHERTALRRLRAARRHRTGAAARRRTRLARQRYHAAQARRRQAVATAARRCRA
ncbi:MAG TPA: serine protease [Solirubrobacteraceae bacterium]|nr:serine protease [Solirubrobacteraceae bacterium]